MTHRPRPRLRPAPGFTLLEVLVALICCAILLSFLYRTMAVVLRTSSQMNERLESQDQRLVLRRMLHRDLQAMTRQGGLTFHAWGFSLPTGHNILTGMPLEVEATWYFSPDGIYRIEENENLSYDSVLRVCDLRDWELEAYGELEARWLPLASLAGEGKDGTLSVTALRLRLGLEGKQRFEIVERLPREVPEQ